ncbi:hypothetical protein F5J12DRAFT_836228 [Pisolithus orientalis]|uniref:uncharacterized protein n=1 Tax=Pisolithus orientalis TaxID=936130 RepID=UPI00222444AB|nr:uncharacterized protein F5J12DRAFT_836228 [Pisolithus orientalis]KAI6005339.1 hypothetical protein F5J12DRAFT_836228 [Pisolithus orientalis]
MSRLASIIANPNGLVILQSSVSQTCLPILRQVLKPTRLPPPQTLLFSFLYPPSSLIGSLASDASLISVFDYTERIPGYDTWTDSQQDILNAIKAAPPGSLRVVIDSVDTLASDISSDSQTFKFIKTIFNLISSRPQPSVLVLHLLSCSLLSLLTQTALSPTLTHVIAHPPVLIEHLITAYSTPPPPAGPAEKFWSVFIPISERAPESQRLVYGPDGTGACTGAGDDAKEFIVELIIRGVGIEGGKRTTERMLEGWNGEAAESPEKLGSLKALLSRKKVDEKPLDPMQSVSFNLHLTASQEESRGRVPLPYAHQLSATCSTIYYEPDSADDIDDDDPDEDLDI